MRIWSVCNVYQPDLINHIVIPDENKLPKLLELNVEHSSIPQCRDGRQSRHWMDRTGSHLRSGPVDPNRDPVQ
jgi:hypothetical protein